MSYNKGAVEKPIYSMKDRCKLLDGEALIIVDNPCEFVSRITLNRPDKHNAMNHELRGQVLNQLQVNDQDSRIRVTIIRGAGPSFCAGYDLDMDKSKPFPMFEAEGEGSFQRNVLKGWFMMMDMAKPIIAEVHGYCLAGGTELASACDIICVANDAKIGYPPVRSMGLPDMQFFPWVLGLRKSMYHMLTGDNFSGIEAAKNGWATFNFPKNDLSEKTLNVAKRVAMIPSDLQQFNKKSVHDAMEHSGMRIGLKAGTNLQCMSFRTETSTLFLQKFNGKQGSAKQAFKERDQMYSLPSKL